ncbi:GNAT family N-acetyltransferase [bacterium]|nr:GNAT family N-acetyltransferase [bacterium]
MIIEKLAAHNLTEFAGLIDKYFKEMRVAQELLGRDRDITIPLVAYASPKSGAWLARSGEQENTIGLVALRTIANRTCELKHIYILPNERRQGNGRILMEHAINFARQAEYHEILLALRPEQEAALKLCDRNGFKRCARYNEDRRAGLFFSYKLIN